MTVEDRPDPEVNITADEDGLWGEITIPLGVTVYVSPLAEHFHTEDCVMCGEPKAPVIRDLAVARGLEPCPVCEP
jgi:hypothetical protein